MCHLCQPSSQTKEGEAAEVGGHLYHTINEQRNRRQCRRLVAYYDLSNSRNLMAGAFFRRLYDGNNCRHPYDAENVSNPC